jgi:hypothetical protein
VGAVRTTRRPDHVRISASGAWADVTMRRRAPVIVVPLMFSTVLTSSLVLARFR